MGGGGKGGGGGHTPKEYPNTLESAQRLKIIDLLCEGVAGHNVSLKNIYLDNTPLQNDDGSYNFNGIEVSALPGTPHQNYLAGFDTTDSITNVGVEITSRKPVVRTITDPLIDRIRISIALGSLVEVKNNGDRIGGTVSLSVKVGSLSYPVKITGKTTSSYNYDVIIDELPDVPFNVDVIRHTPDSTSDKVNNKTYWASMTTSIDAKFNYPNSVVVGMLIDSAQFGGKVPNRTYLNKWMQIKIPVNYDPINRTYDGIWDGQFKTAWSNNPAWVFYDLVTDTRYGAGDRLGDFGCDKWSLYQVGKYCDQIVPDGFGGTEPRFTCNAYISQPRDAKALLDDLASVFRGIAVWNGLNVAALQDSKRDPVATYSNSNVIDGVFQYSGVSQKTIFTAIHVKYNDKTDGYVTKTEYVANDTAIERYGLNVKQITAFGCTSRGQAARVGKWLIETSIRERQMVSFKVGREGIRHMPFDIIEVADNDYAGGHIGGRVLSVNDMIITTDREIGDIASIRYYANGISNIIDVVSVNGTEIHLSKTPEGIEQLGVFSARKSNVAPRLFRALGIKEDVGTYAINAVYHDEYKEAVVDSGVTFDRDNIATTHQPVVNYGTVSHDGDGFIVGWEGNNASEYLIKVYRNDALYQEYKQDTPEIRLTGLGNGEYRAEIRARSQNGKLSEAVIKTWTISYDLQGLLATPELFAVKIDWTNPQYIVNAAKIEIYRSQTNDRAQATKVATVPYPSDSFTQNGVKLSETHYFWLRLIDNAGNHGEWSSISGQCSDDTSAIIESINGKITKSVLGKTLIDELTTDISESIEIPEIDLTEINNDIDELEKKAKAQGNKISEIEKSDKKQSQTIKTLTAADEDLLAGLEAEKKVRAAGDTAEAQQRLSLVAKVRDNKSSITNLTKTVADNESSTATQIEQLTSVVRPKRFDFKDGESFYGKSVKCVFPPTTSTVVYIKFRATDVEGGLSVKLNEVEKANGFRGKNKEDRWYSFKIDSNINADKDNIVVLENPDKTDGGRIYSVVWVDDDGNDFAATEAAADLSRFKETQAEKGKAQTTQLNQAKSTFSSDLNKERNDRAAADKVNAHKIDETTSKVTELTKTVATANKATASKITELTARVDTPIGSNLVRGGNFKEIDAWRSHYHHLSIRDCFISVSSSPAAKSCFKQISSKCFNYSNTVVTIESARKYRFSAWFNSTGKADGRFGFVWNKLNSKYSSREFEVESGWHYKEVVMRGYEFGDNEINPGFCINHHSTKGTGYITSFKFEDVTDSVEFEQKAQSMHTIKTQAIAGGRTAIAGISIGAMVDGQTTESEVIVMADKVGVVRSASDGSVKPMFSVVSGKVGVNGDLIADGTIQGKHIKANQTINAPVIKGGSLNINNRFKVDKYGRVTIQKHKENVGMKITDDNICVYDEDGALRVKIGKLS